MVNGDGDHRRKIRLLFWTKVVEIFIRQLVCKPNIQKQNLDQRSMVEIYQIDRIRMRQNNMVFKTKGWDENT